MKIGEKLTEGPILKKFLLFMIPVLLSNFMQQLYNAADSVIVGRFAGENALAAVGATSALTSLMVNLFVGLSVGSNVVCANCYGANDEEGLSRALHTSILLGIVLGIPLVFAGWFLSETLLGLMGTPVDIMGKAELYMKIIFLGVPAALVYNYGSAVLRAAGDTKRPLYILMISGIINVLLNLLCVIIFKMDVAGVAIGTIVSQLVSAVAVVVIFLRADVGPKLTLKKIKINLRELKNIMAIGLPAGISGTMLRISNVLVQSFINSFGVTVVAANSVAGNYSAFSWIIAVAGEQAATSFVGQNMGARKYDRVNKTVKIATLVTCLLMAIYSVVVVLNGKFFLGFFTDEPAVIEYGIIYLTLVVAPYVLFVPNATFGGALRGMGYALTQTIISFMFICVARVLWIIFVLPIKPIYEMVLISYPLSWLAASITTFIAYEITKKKAFRK